MGWKNWPYWLKGGIIAGILSIIFFYLLSTSLGRESNLLAVLNFPGFIYLLSLLGKSY